MNHRVLFCLTCLVLGIASPAHANDKAKKPKPHYLTPVLEILAQQLTFNLFSRTMGEDYANISPLTAWRNIKSPWVFDEDGFLVNQLGHPYQGALYFTAARSSHHGFWTSAAYTFMGSLAWEYLWETEQPSINDQITTTVGGVLVGEVLRKLSLSLLYNGSKSNSPGWWIGSLLADPMGTFNRDVLSYKHTIERPPPSFGSLSLGFGYFITTDVIERERSRFNQLRLSGNVTYGLPGDPTFTFDGPLDHFDVAVDLDISTNSVLGSIFARGLLVGDRFEFDSVNTQGLWGLFIGQSFFDRGPIRLGAFDLSLGTNIQVRIGEKGFFRTSIGLGIVPMAGGGQRVSSGLRTYQLGAGSSQVVELGLGRTGTGLIKLTSRTVEVFGSLSDGSVDIINTNSLGGKLLIQGRQAIGFEVDTFLSRRRFTNQQKRRTTFNRSVQVRLMYSIQTNSNFGVVFAE